MHILAARNWIIAAAMLTVTACLPEFEASGTGPVEQTVGAEPAPTPEAAPTPEPVPTVSVGDALTDGVVIAISKASQHMYVFRDGVLWDSSPVSTGRRGKATPSGVFAILQKKKFHRSNLYSNAPMPFMQRLTWDGIAIHAGHLPGYPASHGCIRLPRAFAQSLFKQTGFTSTAVIVTDEPLDGERVAYALVSGTDAVIPIEEATLEREHARRIADALIALLKPRPAADNKPVAADSRPVQAAAPTAEQASPAIPDGEQLIQLAAASSRAEADAHWERVVRGQPELAKMRKTVVSAIVGGQQYYRLRASSRDAHATCQQVKQSGIECFAVQ